MGKNKKELANFLQWEYGQTNVIPPVVHLNGTDYTVPYAYVRDYKDPKRAFVKDFFDLMRKDYLKYQRNHEEVKYISLTTKTGAQRLVVPYSMRNSKDTPAKIAKKIFARADKKYWEAVNLSMELAKAYPDRPFRTFIDYPNLKEMRKAHNQFQVRAARDKAAYITKKVGEFLSKNARKATGNIKSLDIAKLKVKARHWAVGFMLAATVSTAVYEAYQINEKRKENAERKELEAKDPCGHVRSFSRCHDAIKTSLAFVENFADSTFTDGEGYPTIGYGCTFYIDENGVGNREISPVKKGDAITMEDAIVQKERYLKFKALPTIQKCVKVPMDDATTIATYNFAYVIGENGFPKSKYLKALNEGKTGHELTRYLTGYRKQKGLLPRFYFMGALLEGKLKASDFLALRAEGCYNLIPEDVCVTEKGKLKIDADGFAEFDFSKLNQNLDKAKKTRRSVALRGGRCQMVQDILPESVIKGTLDMETSQTYKGPLVTTMLDSTGR